MEIILIYSLCIEKILACGFGGRKFWNWDQNMPHSHDWIGTHSGIVHLDSDLNCPRDDFNLVSGSQPSFQHSTQIVNVGALIHQIQFNYKSPNL